METKGEICWMGSALATWQPQAAAPQFLPFLDLQKLLPTSLHSIDVLTVEALPLTCTLLI